MLIRGFNAAGLTVLQEGSSRPHRLHTSFTEEGPPSHVCLAERGTSGASRRAVLEKGRSRPASALACYGVLWQEGQPDDPVRNEMWLRFVTGRPVSDITTQFLDWCCERLALSGKTAWLLVWDNARLSYQPDRANLDERT